MANNYTGTYAGISQGEQVRAKNMTDALNQMEKVANKKDTITNSSAEYPSSKAVYANLSSLNFFPKGTILTFSSEAWNATSAEFKNIWKICDGNNGTPNLINKFLRGSTVSGATGDGKKTLSTAELPSHNHGTGTLKFAGNKTKTASTGSHEHELCIRGAADTRYGLNDDVVGDGKVGTSGNRWTGAAGEHTHEFTATGSISGNVANSGSGQSFDIVPAYYAVIYIMKIKA